MSTPYTPEEVRQQIYDHMKNMCYYWSKINQETEIERMKGLCHSILCIFDGATMGLPPLNITIDVPEEEKADAIENGDRWYEPDMLINGGLYMHDEWNQI